MSYKTTNEVENKIAEVETVAEESNETKNETKEQSNETDEVNETKKEETDEVTEETDEVTEETGEVTEETGEVTEETGEVTEETGEVKATGESTGESTGEVKETEEFNETKEQSDESTENTFLKEILLNDDGASVQLSDDEDDETLRIADNVEYNILDKHHPEIKQLNSNELNSKIIIRRDKLGTISDLNHKTLPIMTRYEKAKILGLRSTQINAGADILIDIPDNIIDGITIAKMELQQKKIPFIVRRPLPNGKSEYWDIKDLEIIE